MPDKVPTAVGVLSLDEATQLVLSALESATESEWAVSDVVVQVVKQFGPTKGVYGHLAMGTARTKEFFRQHYKVGSGFEPGQRVLDRPWTWHRAVLEAAARMSVTPMEMQQQALSNDWTTKHLNALQPGGTVDRVEYAGECDECGFHTRVWDKKPGCRESFGGSPVYCGQCKEPIGSLG